MKKFNIFFSILSLTILLTNCENSKDNEKIDDELFKKLVNKDLEVFKKYDSVHYSTSEYYKRAIFICNNADSIVRSISEDKLNEDTLNVYIQHLNEFSRMKDFVLNYNSFKNIAKSEKIFKIRTYQTLAVNRLLNIYRNNFFPMELQMPIIVPRKTEVKVGEKFIADIYLVGNNSTNKYIVTINNDTIKYGKDSHIPVFEEIPTSKGLKKVNAIMHVYHAGLDQVYDWDISTEYIVK